MDENTLALLIINLQQQEAQLAALQQTTEVLCQRAEILQEISSIMAKMEHNLTRS